MINYNLTSKIFVSFIFNDFLYNLKVNNIISFILINLKLKNFIIK